MRGYYQETAAHYKDRLPALAPVLRQALRDDGPLHHIAQCSDGVLDFLLALDPLPVPAPADESRVAVRRIDQQLSFQMALLDRRLAEARSGYLIRLVLEAEDGAYYCDSVIPGVYLIGSRFLTSHGEVPDPVARGDREMASLATRLRKRRGLPSLNHGGFETEGASGRAATAPADPVHLSGEAPDALAAPCRAALALDSLHYVAYCRPGQVSFAVDMLDHDGLGDHTSLIDASARRRLYRELAVEFGAVAGNLGRVVHPTLGGPLTRMVLDVEQGALYYLRIRRGEYLVGVDLMQEDVARSDATAIRLAELLRTSPASEAAKG